jgi:hypothetical protein
MNWRSEKRIYNTKSWKKPPFFKYLKTVSARTIITAVTYGKIIINFKEFKDSRLPNMRKSNHSLSQSVRSVASQLVSNPVSLFCLFVCQLVSNPFSFFVCLFTSHKHYRHRRKDMNKENFKQEPKQQTIVTAVNTEKK